MTDPRYDEFRDAVWGYYAANQRAMPWRDNHDPYRVFVSELMLQQTGVTRVIPKFELFMAAFPTIAQLASAPLADVLTVWQGLGYNRRAKFLHDAAKMIIDRYDGVFPDTAGDLVALPGVGTNTAGAILAYAYDKRVVFVETNIRTILFHHFYDSTALVSDKELAVVLEESLPDSNYREWYWALMDYGTYLKQTKGGRLDVSRHYKKQSPLKGSRREVRGQIIRVLATGALDESALRDSVDADERFVPALDGLLTDGLVSRTDGLIRLTAE